MAKKLRHRVKGQDGLTLIEVLVSFLLLMIVTLAILGLFSISLSVNLGSLARTDMAYRCQKVVEVVRMQNVLANLPTPANDASCCPLTSGTSATLPPSGCEAFWGTGSSGMGVIEADQGFTLSYSVAAGGVGRIITVTAVPDPTAGRYAGKASIGKAVTYVAEIR